MNVQKQHLSFLFLKVIVATTFWVPLYCNNSDEITLHHEKEVYVLYNMSKFLCGWNPTSNKDFAIKNNFITQYFLAHSKCMELFISNIGTILDSQFICY